MKKVLDGLGLPLIFVRDSQGRPFQPLKDQINFDIPKHWLSLCSKLHSRTSCKKGSSTGPLKLIDCNTRYIVDCISEAPPLNYVALSYLWGSQDGVQRRGLEDSRMTSKLPDDVPKTREDAITATKSLGYDYL
jgi:hypothetical protein